MYTKILIKWYLDFNHILSLILVGSWIESEVVSFFVFSYIRMIGYFWLGKGSRVVPRRVRKLVPRWLEIGVKLLWKYEKTTSSVLPMIVLFLHSFLWSTYLIQEENLSNMNWMKMKCSSNLSIFYIDNSIFRLQKCPSNTVLMFQPRCCKTSRKK